MSDKTINEKLKDIANTLQNFVSSTTDEGSDDETNGVTGAEENALEPNSEGEENSGAEDDAQPSISTDELYGLLQEVSETLKARDEQVNALAETVRLLIKAAPVKKDESDNSAKASAGAGQTSTNPFANLNLRR